MDQLKEDREKRGIDSLTARLAVTGILYHRRLCRSDAQEIKPGN